MKAWYGVSAMAMSMTVAVAMCMRHHLCRSRRVEEEVAVERQYAAPEHPHATRKEHARYAQRTQALDLAESDRELICRGSDAPGDGGEGQDIGCQVGNTVEGVGNHCFRVEHVATDALGHGHAQVGKEANSGDAHARVILVLGGEVDVIVVMVVSVAVAMAAVASSLGESCHGWK